MHHAQLHPGLWIDGLYGFRQAGQPIHTGKKEIFDPTVLQLREHREPELGSLGLGDPHAKPLLLSFQVDRQHQVKRFIEHTLVLAYLDDQTVDVDNRINGL